MLSSDAATSLKNRLADNLRRVRDEIAAACARGGRSPEQITVVAVTKTVGIDAIRMLLELGHDQLAESRAQELVRRAAFVGEFLSRQFARPNPRGALMPRSVAWHMIGHLQRNKVRSVLPVSTMIHSVDSLRLAEEIHAEAEKLGRCQDVLLQVNCSQERTKFGVAVGAATHLAEQLMTLTNLRLVGMMTMAPLVDDPEEARPTFVRLRELFEEVRGERLVGPEFRHLSMGMTGDYRVAIEEGATMVRLGRALFG